MVRVGPVTRTMTSSGHGDVRRPFSRRRASSSLQGCHVDSIDGATTDGTCRRRIHTAIALLAAGKKR